MITAGLNVKWDRAGQHLLGGGACICNNGVPVAAIAEERVSRVRYDGGYSGAWPYCIDVAGIRPSEVDIAVVSNCCDVPLGDSELIRIARDTGIPKGRIVASPSHHLMHASSAFYPSGFEQALILVADNEGNILAERRYCDYWRNRLERISYYVGRGTSISLIRRDCEGWGEMGIGSVWSFFTRWLELGRWTEAGKTMGLAAYGDQGAFSGCRIWETDMEGRVSCLLENYPPDKDRVIRDLFLRQMGTDIGPRRKPTDPITDRERDVAAFLQRETERVFVSAIGALAQKTGITKLCIAGGVGLNCVAVRKVLDMTSIDEIFVQPATGDSGQSLGNALYAYYVLGKGHNRWHQVHNFFGREYRHNEILDALHSDAGSVSWRLMKDVCDSTARLLNLGKVVGWYQGRAELGPRALGHRSILADPRRDEMKQIVNSRVKKRESFRPFAPAVLEPQSDLYFDLPGPAPFMAIVGYVRPTLRHAIPAVTHADNTSRLQKVSEESAPMFHELLSSFWTLTGIPVLLNTSLNLSGEPIAETPSDAINCLIKSEMDYLVLDGYLVWKTCGPGHGFSQRIESM